LKSDEFVTKASKDTRADESTMKASKSETPCLSEPDICQLRSSIDSIDEAILELINRRLGLAQQIGSVKRQSGNQVVDSTRESEILNRLSALNRGPLNPNVLRHIFVDIIAASRAIQQSQRVAYLGPEATFTHIAGMRHFGYSVTYVPEPSIREIFSEVEKGVCNYGVVPVENSVEGSVRHTLDLFFESDLKICAERYQPVSYDLVAESGTLAAIATVYAHPQALSQCRGWLRKYLPGAVTTECGSSASAIRMLSGQEGAGAIVGGEAAAMFGLEVVASKIEDFARSATRFLIIGKENVRPAGRDKTSLMFALAHVPGALSKVLTPIAEAGINLVKIESRPTKHASWSHFFFVDVEGHMEDELIRSAVDKIRPFCLYLKSLGSYPLVASHL
jgi:chorismate mutase/prephenate dehydratase